MLHVISIRQAANFWKLVDDSDLDGCWPWTGLLCRQGYGAWSTCFESQHKKHRAHRVAYTLERGHIPEGLVLDHLCRNRWCVNPAHLEPVTALENLQRGKLGRLRCHDQTDECVQLYRDGWSLERIAHLQGVTRACVTYRLRVIAGVELRRRGRASRTA